MTLQGASTYSGSACPRVAGYGEVLRVRKVTVDDRVQISDRRRSCDKTVVSTNKPDILHFACSVYVYVQCHVLKFMILCSASCKIV